MSTEISTLQVPLLLKEIESKTEDPLEKLTIKKILQVKESSLSNGSPLLIKVFHKFVFNRRPGWQNEMVEKLWEAAGNTKKRCLAR